jgi:high-affinity nickel-transport protein
MIPFSTLGLLILFGMRHALDPDHIAVIDNITFRAMEDRPKVAPWTGTLFSIGHSVSVLVIAVLFGLLGRQFVLPDWLEYMMGWLVIALLMWIGVSNIRALNASKTYIPQGWRSDLLPRAFRRSTHPFVTLTVGAIFGLVVDTAAQIAVWGTTAAAAGGLTGAALIGLAFATGMITIDGADSFLVARLMRTRPDHARTYRRKIGWLIASLSLGMAGFAIFQQIQATELSSWISLLIGSLMTMATLTGLWLGRAGDKTRAN